MWECDGSPVVGTNPEDSPQLTCPWGYDNDPVTGWDGQSQTDLAILDGTGSPITCTGTANDQPIDPTESGTSDGSGCVVTP